MRDQVSDDSLTTSYGWGSAYESRYCSCKRCWFFSCFRVTDLLFGMFWGLSVFFMIKPSLDRAYEYIYTERPNSASIVAYLKWCDFRDPFGRKLTDMKDVMSLLSLPDGPNDQVQHVPRTFEKRGSADDR